MTERISRRHALTGAALLGVSVPTLAACGGDDDSEGDTEPNGGTRIDAADVPVGGGAIFADAGVVITQPSKGNFVGFENVCTHQRCRLKDVTDTINCGCHGSRFAINDGANVEGPNDAVAGSLQPLPQVTLDVAGNQITVS